MDEFRLPVITINREYGAGGRTIAKELSNRLGIPWHDQDLVEEVARDSGYSIEEIKKEGEELSQAERFWDYLMNGNVTYNSSHDKIFEAQKNEVLKLAENPCIIVGRCSNIIVRKAKIRSFDVFLYADLTTKADWLKASENCPKNVDIRHFIEKRNALRQNYYKHYAKKTLGSYEDYDLLIDTGKIGYEKTVEIIATALDR